MQNLKSLNNLLAQPVMGKNDDAIRNNRGKCVDLYSYEDVVQDMLKEIEEPQRKLLQKQLLKSSYQD